MIPVILNNERHATHTFTGKYELVAQSCLPFLVYEVKHLPVADLRVLLYYCHSKVSDAGILLCLLSLSTQRADKGKS